MQQKMLGDHKLLSRFHFFVKFYSENCLIISQTKLHNRKVPTENVF